MEHFSVEKLNFKLDDVLDHLKYAPKLIVVFCFLMKDTEDSSCRFV